MRSSFAFAVVASILALAGCEPTQAHPPGHGAGGSGMGGTGGSAAGGSGGPGDGGSGGTGVGGTGGTLPGGGDGGGGVPPVCPEDVTLPALDDLGTTAIRTVTGTGADRILAELAGPGGVRVTAGVLSDGADVGDGPIHVSGVDDAYVASSGGESGPWVRHLVSPEQDRVEAVAIAPDGDVFVSYTLAWSIFDRDIVLARLDAADGHELWSKKGDVFSALAVDGHGDVFTGSICVPEHDGRTMFCVEKRRGDSGEVVWHKMFGGDYANDHVNLMVEASGDLLVSGSAGEQHSSVDFGDGDPVHGSTGFAFLLRMDSRDGKLLWKLPFASPPGGFGNSGWGGLTLAPDGDVVGVATAINDLLLDGEDHSPPAGETSTLLLKVDVATGKLRFVHTLPHAVIGAGSGGDVPMVIDGDRWILAATLYGDIPLEGGTLDLADMYNLVLLDASPVDGLVRQVRVVATAPQLVLGGMNAACDGTLRIAAYYVGDLMVGAEVREGDDFFSDVVELELPPAP